MQKERQGQLICSSLTPVMKRDMLCAGGQQKSFDFSWVGLFRCSLSVLLLKLFQKNFFLALSKVFPTLHFPMCFCNDDFFF